MENNLLSWYYKGFNDELFGSSTIMNYSKEEEAAYNVGVKHAQREETDQLTIEQILEEIKKEV